MVSETTWIENSREFHVSSKVYVDIIVFITLSLTVMVIIHRYIINCLRNFYNVHRTNLLILQLRRSQIQM